MTKKYNSMKGINNYGEELFEKQKTNKSLRGRVGGLWEELGLIQLEFMQAQGLKPNDKLLDIGCGCLRGGIKFINYLNSDMYFGLDINESLINAGIHEIKLEGLEDKRPKLIINDVFNFKLFNIKFEYMISVSLFTHLPLNIIIRCLVEAKKCLKANGKYFSSVFLAPRSCYLEPLKHSPGNITTNYDHDPFHYSFEEISLIAELCGLKARLIGSWNHPRAQQMIEFMHVN
jgi:cyclopropane fatty-acyl-phospholipid synthase-like methyltransferase